MIFFCSRIFRASYILSLDVMILISYCSTGSDMNYIAGKLPLQPFAAFNL